MQTYNITPEQNERLRLIALRHINNLVEEMAVRSDLASEIPLLDRGLVALTLAAHIASYSIGNSLALAGVSKEDAEEALERLTKASAEQFATGHVAGMMAVAEKEKAPDAPPL